MNITKFYTSWGYLVVSSIPKFTGLEPNSVLTYILIILLTSNEGIVVGRIDYNLVFLGLEGVKKWAHLGSKNSKGDGRDKYLQAKLSATLINARLNEYNQKN